MAVSKETKAKLVKEFGKDKGCGATEAQIAILTYEINDLMSEMSPDEILANAQDAGKPINMDVEVY